jgi:hypothetical protein
MYSCFKVVKSESPLAESARNSRIKLPERIQLFRISEYGTAGPPRNYKEVFSLVPQIRQGKSSAV